MRWFEWSAALVLSVSSTAAAQTSLTGYVRDDETLRGLQGVEVSVTGGEQKTRTDKDGRYTLRDLAPGAVNLHLRLVGFAAIDTIFTVAGDKTEAVFFLAKTPVQLDTVQTVGKGRVAVGFDAFEARRALGFGKFLDSTFLRQNQHRELADLMRELGTVEVMTPLTCDGTNYGMLYCSRRVAVRKRGGATLCLVQVVLDGTVISRGGLIDRLNPPLGATKAILDAYRREREKVWAPTFDLNSVSVSGLGGLEFYQTTAEAPGGFASGDSGCGVLVLWTRR